MTMGEVIRDYEKKGIERIVSGGEILSTEESLVLNYGRNKGKTNTGGEINGRKIKRA